MAINGAAIATRKRDRHPDQTKGEGSRTPRGSAPGSVDF
jgi:hypothetical protein